MILNFMLIIYITAQQLKNILIVQLKYLSICKHFGGILGWDEIHHSFSNKINEKYFLI